MSGTNTLDGDPPHEANEPLSPDDPVWEQEFTGFFLQMSEGLRSESTDMGPYCDKMVQYLEGGFLQPGNEVLSVAHRNFVMYDALPQLITGLLKRSAYYYASDVPKFKVGQSFITAFIRWATPWIPLQNSHVISLLRQCFSKNANLYRFHMHNHELGRYVRTLYNESAPIPAEAWSRLDRGTAWSSSPMDYLFVMHVNLFGSLNGFEMLRKQFSGDPLPPRFLRECVNLLHGMRLSYGPKLNAFVATLPALVFQHQLLDLDHNHLRQVEKADIEKVVEHMRDILRTCVGSVDCDECCNQFCLDFALKCLKSKIQEKKFHGLAYIEEAIDGLAREKAAAQRHVTSIESLRRVQERTRDLLAWIRDHKIVETVYQKENMRQELIVRSKKILRFLASENELDTAHVATILQGIRAHSHERNWDVRNALYDTLVESAPNMTRRDLVMLVWDHIRVQPVGSGNVKTIALVCGLMEAARTTDFRMELVQWLWDQVQDNAGVSREAHDMALDRLIDVAMPQAGANAAGSGSGSSNGAGGAGASAASSSPSTSSSTSATSSSVDAPLVDFVGDCVNNVKQHRSTLQSLRLLKGILERMRPSARQAQALVLLAAPQDEGHDLFTALLAELASYKVRAVDTVARLSRRGHQLDDWSGTVVCGVYSHVEQIRGRLSMLRDLLTMAGSAMDPASLPVLWTTLMENMASPRQEVELALDWLYHFCGLSDATATEAYRVLFQHHLCNNLHLATTSESAWDTFVSAFFRVNVDSGAVRAIKLPQEWATVQPDALVGEQQLWDLVTKWVPDAVQERGVNLLTALYLRVDTDAPDEANGARKRFCRLVVERLRECSHSLARRSGDGDGGGGASPRSYAIDGDHDDAAADLILEDDDDMDGDDHTQTPPAGANSVPMQVTIRRLLNVMKLVIEQTVAASSDGDDGGGGGGGDAEAGKAADNAPVVAKEPAPVPTSDTEKGSVDMFVEIAGDMLGPPGPYRNLVALLVLRKNAGDVSRACNALFGGNESLLAEAMSAAELYELEPVAEDPAKGGVVSAGVPAATILGDDAQTYDLLFQLLHREPALETEVWHVLQQLPPNQELMEHLHALEPADRDHYAWDDVLGSEPDYRLLYSLEIVDRFIPYREDSTTAQETKLAWCKLFLHCGGFQHLFALLTRIAPEKNPNKCAKSCLAHLLKIVYYFMRNKLAEHLPWEQDEPQEDTRAALTFSYVSSEKMISEAPFDQFPHIMWTLIRGRANMDTREDTPTVVYSVYLLVGAILRTPHLLNHLYDLPGFDRQVLHVLCCRNESVRQQVSSRLAHLCAHFTNSDTRPAREEPSRYFLRLLLQNIPHTPDPSVAWNHFFQLLNDLLLNADEGTVSTAVAESLGANVTASTLIDRVAEWIRGREVVENTSYDAPDQTLAGFMGVLRTLLLKTGSREVKEKLCDSSGGNLMSELLDRCLFASPSTLTESGRHVYTRVNESKCKVRSTRAAGFALLAECCKDCPTNLDEVLHFIADRHLQQPPIKRWEDLGSLEKSTQYVGLRNLGATCYMNSLCQQLYMIPSLRDELLNAISALRPELNPACGPEPSGKGKGPARSDVMVSQFQRMMGFLRESDSPFFDTEPFVRCLRVDGRAVDPRVQEDCLEFFQRLQEQLEERLKGQPAVDVFTRMFTISTERWFVCQGHENELPGSTENVLQAEFAPSLEAALEKTFNLSGDPVSGYHCGVCNDKVNGIIRAAVKSDKLPDQLVIMLRRFEWDYNGPITRRKILDHFEISKRINLAAYTRRGRCAVELGQPVPADPEMDYDLAGILVHSGSTMDSGHYYSIISNIRSVPRGEPVRWYKFDDRTVTEYDEAELDEMSSKFIGECYMLFYERSAQAFNPKSGKAPLPRTLAQEILHQNATLLEHRLFESPTYFDFLFSAFSHASFEPVTVYCVPPTIGAAPQHQTTTHSPEHELGNDVALKAIQMSTLFVVETLLRHRDESLRGRFTEWINILIRLYERHVPACAWLLDTMSGSERRRWVQFLLLECAQGWVRENFARLCLHVMKVLAPHEYPLFPRKAVEETEDYLRLQAKAAAKAAAAAEAKEGADDAGKADDGGEGDDGDSDVDAMDDDDEEESEEEEDAETRRQREEEAARKKREAEELRLLDVSWNTERAVVPRFMNYVLGLIEFSRKHWSQHHQYFDLIRDYALSGENERLHLASCSIPSYAGPHLRFAALWIDYYLGHFNDDLSPAQKSKRVRIGDTVRGISADLESYFQSFAAVILAMSTDTGDAYPPTIIKCESYPPPRMDKESQRYFFRSNLWQSIMKQGYNLQVTRDILSHWCWELPDRTQFFVAQAMLSIESAWTVREKYLACVDAFVCVMNLKDSLQQHRIQAILQPEPAPGTPKSLLSFLRAQHYSGSRSGGHRGEMDMDRVVGSFKLMSERLFPDNEAATWWMSTHSDAWSTWLLPTLRERFETDVHAEQLHAFYSDLRDGVFTTEGAWDVSLTEQTAAPEEVPQQVPQ